MIQGQAAFPLGRPSPLLTHTPTDEATSVLKRMCRWAIRVSYRGRSAEVGRGRNPGHTYLVKPATEGRFLPREVPLSNLYKGSFRLAVAE